MRKISVENRRVFSKISNATDRRLKSVKGIYRKRPRGSLLSSYLYPSTLPLSRLAPSEAGVLKKLSLADLA
jgi:hypothetical protein